MAPQTCTQTSTTSPTLTRATDRCDRCGAQAWVKVNVIVSEGDLPLLFCKHHYERNEKALVQRENVAVVVDDRAHINHKPTS
jgi:hypothetical protein